MGLLWLCVTSRLLLPSLSANDAGFAPDMSTDNSSATAPSVLPAKACWKIGVSYTPLDMANQGRTKVASIQECETRCSSVSGCAHFTFWRDGGCHLQDDAATIDLGYCNWNVYQLISGPPSCSLPQTCLSFGIAYEPLNMDGQFRSDAATAEDCQARCATVSGCAHFSFWYDGGCHVQNTASTVYLEAGATSGEASCSQTPATTWTATAGDTFRGTYKSSLPLAKEQGMVLHIDSWPSVARFRFYPLDETWGKCASELIVSGALDVETRAWVFTPGAWTTHNCDTMNYNGTHWEFVGIHALRLNGTLSADGSAFTGKFAGYQSEFAHVHGTFSTLKATCDDAVPWDSASDDYYDSSCDAYFFYPFWCGQFDDTDFSSETACCACHADKTCVDDPSWTDHVYGTGNRTCVDLVVDPVLCDGDTMYSIAAARGCPLTCGVCKSEAWNLVDVPAVVCTSDPSAPGSVSIPISPAGIKDMQKAHYLTFYRTTDQEVGVTYSLKDANNRLIDQRKVQFPALEHVSWETARRLHTQTADELDETAVSTPQENADGGGGTCEAFFLLDGRSPIDIPDTWGEARAQFHAMCIQEGYSELGCEQAQIDVFTSHPAGYEDQLDMSSPLCSRLMYHAEALQDAEVDSEGFPVDPDVVPLSVQANISTFSVPPRRMKGVSGAMAGHFQAGGAYRSTTRMRLYYPRGYYGYYVGGTQYYAGRDAKLKGQQVPLLGAAAAGAAVATVASRYEHSRYRSLCHSTGPCDQWYTLTDDANRDDIPLYDFVPESYAYPLTLTISEIVGPDFAASTICPPNGVQTKDLFVTFTEADANIVTFGSILTWLAILGVCCCCTIPCGIPCICCAILCWPCKRLGEACGLLPTRQSDTQYGPLHGEEPVSPETASVGMRVQTQNTREEGGDDGWYGGKIVAISGINVTIEYHDGDRWYGPMTNVYPVNG